MPGAWGAKAFARSQKFRVEDHGELCELELLEGFELGKERNRD